MSQGIQPALSQELAASLGPKLLGHVRSLDAAGSTASSNGKSVDQAIECLKSLIAVASRQGILQKDVQMAESLLMASMVNAAPSHSKNNSKKRRSIDDDVAEPTNATLSTTLPVQLVMTAIFRVLGLNTLDTTNNSDLLLLIALAADFIRAVVQHTRHSQYADGSRSPSIFQQAEYGWIQGSAKSLLSALSQCARKLVVNLKTENSCSDDYLVEICEALTSCLWASADLIELAGTKLSRSLAILSTLQEIAWDAMSCNTTFTNNEAPAKLLANLTLAGGTDRATPCSLWTKSMQHTQGMLWMLLQKAFPISQRIKTRENVSIPTGLQQRVDDWWATLHRMESQENRVSFVLNLVKSLVCHLLELLKLGHTNMTLLDATVNIPSLLDLIDALLALPIASEASYYGTKKRLRDEPIENSALSPASIATQIANHIYAEGQRLLSHTVTTIGGPSLLPYAKRLQQLGHASVLTSCSPTLRQVLEPGHNATKKRRWLAHSLVVRTKALNTLQTLVVVFGVKATSERTKTLRRSTGEIDQVVKVVSGCLLEQLLPQGDGDSLDWGSEQEKTALISAAADCLSSVLSCGGEFLSMETRQLVESVTATCLSDVTRQTSPRASIHSPSLHESFLNLGKACVSTSWPDGAASVLRNPLRQAARSISTADASLSQIAISAMQLCDTLSHPAVPALYVALRQKEDTSSATTEAFANKLDQARSNAMVQKERQAEDQKRKKAKLETKQASTTAAAPNRVNERKSRTTSLAPKPLAGHFNKEIAGSITSFTEKTTKNEPSNSKPESQADASPKLIQSPSTTNEPSPAPKATNTKADEETDLDDDFPMIVDAGPDDEDIDDDE